MKKSAILADCVYSFLIFREPSSEDAFSVPSKRGRHKALFRIQTPYSSRQIFAGTQKEARVARPLDPLYCVMMTCMHMMLYERREFKAIVRVDPRGWRCMPNLYESTDANSKMAP